MIITFLPPKVLFYATFNSSAFKRIETRKKIPNQYVNIIVLLKKEPRAWNDFTEWSTNCFAVSQLTDCFSPDTFRLVMLSFTFKFQRHPSAQPATFVVKNWLPFQLAPSDERTSSDHFTKNPSSKTSYGLQFSNMKCTVLVTSFLWLRSCKEFDQVSFPSFGVLDRKSVV